MLSRRDGIQVIPGPESFHAAEGAVIHFENGKVTAIDETGKDSRNLEAYELEPQLVTALFEGQDRSKREIIKFDEIPKVAGGRGARHRRSPLLPT